MRWVKIFVIGLAATLSMDVSSALIEFLAGSLPMNMHPAGAFLYTLDIESDVLTLLLHYVYGIFWTFFFYYVFNSEIGLKEGLVYGLLLWLFMMLVYSPIVGWGVFGFGNAELLSQNHPLYLTNTFYFIGQTLIVHLIYGSILFLGDRFILKKYANN